MTEYNVAKLAADLDLEAHIVRAKLRSAKIPKVEGRYEWAKSKDYDAVLKQLKTGAKTEVKDEPKGKSKKEKVEDKNAAAAPENKAGKGKKSKKD